MFSVVALYIYYPAPERAFAEIVRVRADAVRTDHREEAIRPIQQWDLRTRKLQVGVFIRTGRLDPELSQFTADLRETLEALRDTLLANELSEAKAIQSKVDAAYHKCRDAFQSRGTP